MKKNSDLISIIVPVYNAEKFLKDTINCILNQTYQNWELILVDDCSNDNSAKLIKSFAKNDKRIKYIKMPKNGGSALARNKGIDEAKGKFLCFQDADDLWDKDKLEKQINFMQNKDCAFSFTSYEYTDEFGVPNGKKVVVPEKINYNKALKNTVIWTSTVMFNLSKIEKELIKMPDLKYVEDTATWWKILRNDYNAYGIKDVFSYYRRTSTSQSAKKLRTMKNLWNLYIKVEKLNFIRASYCFILKNINAILRRI